jgi:hypothetical protein
MIVTVKDSRGLLVSGAKIKIRSKAAGRLTRRAQIKASSKTGQAAFVLRVKPRILGKRLVMVTVARTPTAKAAKTTRSASRRHAAPGSTSPRSSSNRQSADAARAASAAGPAGARS